MPDTSVHSNLCFLDATELAALIRSRALSPVDVVRAHLARIEAVNPKINAIVTLIDDAEARARDAEAAVLRGDRLGPLHGVPFTVKDSLDTAGIRTTRGSRLFASHVPRADATVVQRLKAAGAIPIGKTNVPEFTLWWETGNLLFGRTVNPWNPERTVGGSSGGEAAAIAAGLSPLGIGSDGAGSIRAPAHYCGIAGLKPTHGRVPLTGQWPEMLLRFNHLGPMARTVRDVALALTVMAGPDGHDWYAMPVAAPEAPDRHSALMPLRIGWMATRGFGLVHPEVVAAVAGAAKALSAHGLTVEPVAIPALEAHDWNLASMTLQLPEAQGYLRPIVAGRETELHPVIQRRLSAPIGTLEGYATASAAVEALRRDVADYFTRWDLLLCPTVPLAAHPHETAEIRIQDEVLPPRHTLRATVPFNLTGSPALSVPWGWSSEGLPLAVQVVGRHFAEETVLRLGLALETLRGDGPGHPPLHQ